MKGCGIVEICGCGGTYHFRAYCGVQVCEDCERHEGLDRCYCGWSAGGGDGRRELEEMGEVIEPDDELWAGPGFHQFF